MEKQEVKLILDRLFDMSVLATEKKHSFDYTYRNTYDSICLHYYNGPYYEGAKATLISHRFLNLPGELELLEADIKLIESHLNS